MGDAADSDIAEIRRLEERRCRATVERDFAALDELFDEELVYTHSSSARESKAEYVGAIRARKYDYKKIDRPDQKVSAWGDAAMIVGRMEIDIEIGGQPKHVSSAYTGVWRRNGGRWRMVALQSTGIPAKT